MKMKQKRGREQINSIKIKYDKKNNNRNITERRTIRKYEICFYHDFMTNNLGSLSVKESA